MIWNLVVFVGSVFCIFCIRKLKNLVDRQAGVLVKQDECIANQLECIRAQRVTLNAQAETIRVQHEAITAALKVARGDGDEVHS